MGKTSVDIFLVSGLNKYFEKWQIILKIRKGINIKIFAHNPHKITPRKALMESMPGWTYRGTKSRRLKSLHTEQILKPKHKSQRQTAKWNVDMFSQNLNSASGFVSANRPFGKISNALKEKAIFSFTQRKY